MSKNDENNKEVPQQEGQTEEALKTTKELYDLQAQVEVDTQSPFTLMMGDNNNNYKLLAIVLVGGLMFMNVYGSKKVRKMFGL